MERIVRGEGNWDGGRAVVRRGKGANGRERARSVSWSGRRWKRRLFWLRDMKSPNEWMSVMVRVSEYERVKDAEMNDEFVTDEYYDRHGARMIWNEPDIRTV